MNNTENNFLAGKRICYLSLGCKVNAYETERFREQFEARGAITVPFEEGGADAVIINTCSVTNIADRKSRQMLHRARSLNPKAVVIAAGCYVQAVGDEVRSSGDADIAVPNTDKDSIVELVSAAFEAAAGSCISSECVDPAQSRPGTAKVPASGKDSEDEQNGCHERTRAFIKVQDGCNQFCAYCIIPYVRGRVRSRSIEDVKGEVLRLREKGYKEVVLTGIHLSSFGVDNYEKASKNGFYGEPLIKLIEAVSAIDGIERIRLGSLEPRIITSEFLDGISRYKQVCPHFHLSLQSGSDTVLKRMNRHYTTAEYENDCRLIRGTYDSPSINTDIIVGFPGESEEEFNETCEYVERIGFAKVHVFKYSRRKGTVADRMPDQISEQVKNERSARLIKIDEANHRKYIGQFVGKHVKVLLEQENDSHGKRYMTGLTERYVQTGIPLEAGREDRYSSNTFVDCLITGISEGGFLIGQAD